MDPAQFYELFKALISPNNDLRNQAEATLKELQKNPVWLIPALSTLVKEAPDAGPRQLAVVVLRKTLATMEGDDDNKVHTFTKLNGETQTGIKAGLLTQLDSETEKIVRLSLVQCVAVLASQLIDPPTKNDWQELFPNLYNKLQSGNPTQKSTALSVISALCAYSEEAVQAQAQTMHQALGYCLSSQNDLSVRVAAMECTVTVASNVTEGQLKEFAGLLGSMGEVLNTALQAGPSGNEDTLRVLQSFISLASDCPTFLAKEHKSILVGMLGIAEMDSADCDIRRSAVEFLLTFCESEPVKCKRTEGLVNRLFKIGMDFMALIPEQDDWATTSPEDDDDDEEGTQMYSSGVDVLDRMSIALRGKAVQPVASVLLEARLKEEKWQHRHASLVGLAQIAEGCSTQLERGLAGILTLVINQCKDPHPRVRWSAVHCLAQLCVDFCPGIQTTFASTVLPAAMSLLQDPAPRIRAQAAQCCDRFLEDSELEMVKPRMDELVAALLVVARDAGMNVHFFVIEEVLTCLSTIAGLCEEEFGKYFDSCLPVLKAVLELQPNNVAGRSARAQALTCITELGQAVGKEKFQPHAMQLMEMMKQAQAELKPDDPLMTHLGEAWARIAKVLGPNDFAHMLPLVIPPLIHQAGVTSDVEMVDASEQEEEEEEGVESLTLAIKGVGFKTIKIHTQMLDDKLFSLKMLDLYFSDIPERMAPYIGEVGKIVHKLLGFPYSEEVRKTCAEMVPSFMRSMAKYHEVVQDKDPNVPDARVVFNEYIPRFLECMTKEPEPAILASQCEYMREMLGLAGKDWVGDTLLNKCAEVLYNIFEESLSRKAELKESKKDCEGDEDEMEKVEEGEGNEDVLLSEAVELTGAYVKSHRGFIQYFTTKFWPLCEKILSPGKTPFDDSDRSVALCVFCDFIEHAPDDVIAEHGQIAGKMAKYWAEYIDSEDVEVIQACCYGIGVAITRLPIFKEERHLQTAMNKLIGIAGHAEAKETYRHPPTANAISSLWKIMEAYPDVPVVQSSIPGIMSMTVQLLPLQGDEQEAIFVHKRLLAMTQANNPLILGENNSNMAKLIEAFKALLDTEYVDEETNNLIKTLLAAVGSS